MPWKKRPTLEDVVDGLARYVGLKAARSSVIGMACFDILIGNADRHQSNWGILVSRGVARMAPWYDHGSGFGNGLDPELVRRYVTQGLDRFDSGFRYEIAVSPDRSKARLDELLKALRTLDRSLAGFQDLLRGMTDEVIDALIASVTDQERIMEPERWQLAREIVRHRREVILGGAGGGFSGAA